MTSLPNAAAEKTAKPRDRYWRSLSELHETTEFKQFLHREFPVAASEYPEGVSRRRWLQLMAASMSVAGAVGCRYPTETIAPFVLRPEGRLPGEFYSRSTNFELAGRVYNLLVTNVDGRPIKIEGNAKHPCGGGTDSYVQACILGLYDPDRARGDDGVVLRRDDKGVAKAVQWAEADEFAAGLVKSAEANAGKTFAVLVSPTQSPSVVRMLKALRDRLPQMTLCRFDGVHGDVMRVATKTAIGTSSKQLLELDKAKVVLAIESDFLGSDSSFTRNAKKFTVTRDPGAGPMSRLYVVEGGYTNTGVVADARLATRPSQMAAMISEVERRIDKLVANGVAEVDSDEKAFDELDPMSKVERFLSVVCQELKNGGEGSLVLVGETLGADAVAAGIRINSKLGSLGKLQRFVPLVDDGLGEVVSLRDLVVAADAGNFESMVILGGNPGFAAPGDVPLLTAIASIKNTVYLGDYDDETAASCQFSLPLAHPLESWGDCVSDDGTYGVCQPQILPLLGGRTVVELLAAMLGADEKQGRDIVRRTADAVAGQSLSDRQWRKFLHDGFDTTVAMPAPDVKYQGPTELLTADTPVASLDVDQDDIDLLFVAADGIYDGRFANNGWLQEMPQSLTKLTWDNAAVMSPRTAKALAVEADGSKVALRRGDATIELPVYQMPGCAPGVVTVAIGYGRSRAGMVGGFTESDVPVVGVDVSPLRTMDAMRLATKVEGRPRYSDYRLAVTQDHWAIDDLGKQETERRSFDLIREGTVALMEKNEYFASDKGPHVPHVGESGSPWSEPMDAIQIERPNLPQWGMSIDLNKCFGCNACVVACQSENNIPIVGKEQVIRSREMHWIRIDRYFQGDEDHANVVTQPMACQHCETAPCEQVCPVAATVHTDEGLNAMAYNRCIGTRYCANNCPFKVRRFNYFNYNSEVGVGYGIDAYPSAIEKANRKLQALVLSPDVTVRGRGVMEKCTYCVQRIEAGKIDARKDGGRPVRDGEIKSACQMACPSGAIEFGNIQDETAVVTKKQNDPRAYGMLSQLNVKPRTIYLAKIHHRAERWMTVIHLADLQKYGKPQEHGAGHGHDDSHGTGHGTGHGDESHSHDHDHEHEHEHADEKAATS